MANTHQGTSRSKIRVRTDTLGLPRSRSIRRTDTACSTWPATSGSGPAIGIAPTTTSNWRPRRRSPQSARAGFALRSRGADREEESSSRRIISLHRSILLALHGRDAWQGRGQHGNQPSRVSLCDDARPAASAGRNNRSWLLEGLALPVSRIQCAEEIECLFRLSRSSITNRMHHDWLVVAAEDTTAAGSSAPPQ